MTRLRHLWTGLLSSLWFLPLAIVTASVVTAMLLVEVSGRIDAEALRRWPRLFGASAGSSRDMLAAIAGSMITVAGVTFSITMLAVTQASTQYTPRILRNFMRDRPSQVVLGGLAGVFTYCLVVLRTIRGGDENTYIPSIAVLFAFVLAGAGVALLIYFVHHMATALQASSIVAQVSRDTIRAVDALFPSEVGRAAPHPNDPRVATEDWTPVRATKTGYVQRVDPAALIATAVEHDGMIRMECGVGDFVVEGAPLACWAGRSGRSGERVAAPIRASYSIDTFRTVEQDPAFGIRQLVDIAVKALSPGINDPTTAMNCVDYLGAVLTRAAQRGEEPDQRAVDGEIRVLARGPTFCTLADLAIAEIRRYGEGHAEVIMRLIGIIEAVGRATTDRSRRSHLAGQVTLIAEGIERAIRAPVDRDALLARAAAVRAGLAIA